MLSDKLTLSLVLNDGKTRCIFIYTCKLNKCLVIMLIKAQAAEERSKKLGQEMQCNRHNMEAVKTSLEQKVGSFYIAISIQ